MQSQQSEERIFEGAGMSVKCLPDIVREFLDDCGVAWRIEQGKKHNKIFVGDRLVGVFHAGARDPNWRTAQNLRTTIKQNLRAIAEASQTAPSTTRRSKEQPI
jgi:hypothetical protein